MKLYFSPGACSMATHIALEWTGQPYEIQKVSIHGAKSPELLEHNPMGCVPMLEDDGLWLTQNSAILNYVAECYPDARIGGDDTPKGRAEVNRWIGYVNADMHPAFKPLFGATAYLGDEAVIEKTKANARDTLLQRFALVDRHLAGREWLAGSHHSVADAYLFVLTTWAPRVGVDISGLPNLQAFIARMKADPAVGRVRDAEAKAAKA